MQKKEIIKSCEYINKEIIVSDWGRVYIFDKLDSENLKQRIYQQFEGKNYYVMTVGSKNVSTCESNLCVLVRKIC